MELDKRIKAITDIQSVTDGCHDWEFMTKKGYFADRLANFQDLSKCEYGEYVDYREHDKCFHCEVILPDGTTNYNWFSYFLPEDSLLPEEKPEKKYRPYSLNEFLNEHEIGDKITYRTCRFKESKEQEFIRYKAMICGYQIMEGEANTPGKGFINLGGYWVSLQVMFDDYETPNSYLYPEVWEPFGVLDKENE